LEQPSQTQRRSALGLARLLQKAREFPQAGSSNKQAVALFKPLIAKQILDDITGVCFYQAKVVIKASLVVGNTVSQMLWTGQHHLQISGKPTF